MQVTGTVIQVALNAPIKKKDGGTYEGWQLVYNTPQGEVKTIAKPIQGLKYNPNLKNGLQDLKPGDEFSMEMEKNAGGFWDPKTVTKGVANAPGQQAEVGMPKTAATKSTYETSEERAVKQVYIVRQSSIANAINFLNVSGAKKHTTEEALAIAKQFEAFVFGTEPATSDGVANFDDFENDMPM